jgi:hypothetical protein
MKKKRSFLSLLSFFFFLVMILDHNVKYAFKFLQDMVMLVA